MKNMLFATALVASCAAFADADLLNRAPGIKIGERLTLRPYVCLSYTFDSNPDSTRDGDDNASYWSINPGFDFDFAGENWKVIGNAYYQYHAFSSGRETSLNNSSYGEQLGFQWSNIANGGAGWAMEISERYQVVNQNDDFSNGDGRGLWRDRQQFDATAIFQRRFNDHWHAAVNASYYWLDYANDATQYAHLYGWDRWTAGMQIGYTASKWTDIFIAGNYQGYSQDTFDRLSNISRESRGWTVHVGVGSYLTDRISYRVSGGFSQFEYGDSSTANGFTYQGNLNWKFGDTWSTTLLFASYYQPSERQYGSSIRCDSVSWGLAKSLVRGKLNATLDAAYRRDTHVYNTGAASDWDLNIITARLGLNYRINRIFTVFARGEFQSELNGGDGVGRHYDYERWRATVGVKFTY